MKNYATPRLFEYVVTIGDKKYIAFATSRRSVCQTHSVKPEQVRLNMRPGVDVYPRIGSIERASTTP